MSFHFSVVKYDSHSNVIQASNGDDTITGKLRDSQISLGAGDDYVNLGSSTGNNIREGEGDNCIIDAGEIYGDEGDDVLSASGNITGDTGDDVISTDGWPCSQQHFLFQRQQQRYFSAALRKRHRLLERRFGKQYLVFKRAEPQSQLERCHKSCGRRLQLHSRQFGRNDQNLHFGRKGSSASRQQLRRQGDCCRFRQRRFHV